MYHCGASSAVSHWICTKQVFSTYILLFYQVFFRFRQRYSYRDRQTETERERQRQRDRQREGICCVLTNKQMYIWLWLKSNKISLWRKKRFIAHWGQLGATSRRDQCLFFSSHKYLMHPDSLSLSLSLAYLEWLAEQAHTSICRNHFRKYLPAFLTICM